MNGNLYYFVVPMTLPGSWTIWHFVPGCHHPVETSVVIVLTVVGRQIHPARRMAVTGDLTNYLYELLAVACDQIRLTCKGRTIWFLGGGGARLFLKKNVCLQISVKKNIWWKLVHKKIICWKIVPKKLLIILIVDNFWRGSSKCNLKLTTYKE